jgi:hypothetical protein
LQIKASTIYQGPSGLREQTTFFLERRVTLWVASAKLTLSDDKGKTRFSLRISTKERAFRNKRIVLFYKEQLGWLQA